MKVARTVLSGGKSERIYLSQLDGKFFDIMCGKIPIILKVKNNKLNKQNMINLVCFKEINFSRVESREIKFIKAEGTRFYNTRSIKKLKDINEDKFLVVWGTNLPSLAGYGRLTKQISHMIKLPPYQYSVLVGILLSDGYACKAATSSKEARIMLTSSRKNFQYIWFVFIIISHYCNTGPVYDQSMRCGKLQYSVRLLTRSLPCITELYTLFYDGKVKIIPDNIYDLLTPPALAHFIMKDGVALAYGLTICTDSFTIIEVVKLMNVLLIRYDLDSLLRYHTSSQPRIYIRSGSMSKLREIVEPYMAPSMMYKINPQRKKQDKI